MKPCAWLLAGVSMLGCGGNARGPARAGTGPNPFDRGAAAAALGSVRIDACAREGGPQGLGHIKVVFEPDGTVSEAKVDFPSNLPVNDFRGTDVAACVEEKFRAPRIPPFAGTRVPVGKTFDVRVNREGASPEAAGGMTYEHAILIASNHHDARPSSLTDAQLQAPMRNATFIAACGAPNSMKLTVKVVVRLGRALGVTVEGRPADAAIERCVGNAVRTLQWPADPAFDSFTVTY